MKLHPRMAALQRFADYERRGRVADHLAGCPRCRETIVWIRSTRAALAVAGDVAAPAGAWDRIRTRLEDGDVVLLPAASVADDQVRARRPAVRAAAAALFVLAAGVAAAAPGSPVRDWVRAVVARLDPAPTAPVDSAATADASVPAIFAIEPFEGNAAVEVANPDTSVTLRIRLVDDAALTVRADGAAAHATFTSGAGRLTITAPGAGDISIDVPRAAASVTIGVNGRPYLVRRGGELTIYLPGVDTAGAEIVLPVQR